MMGAWKMNMDIGKYLLPALLLMATSSAFGETARWYSVDQVTLGQKIFKQKCAKCHGENAEGEPDWRRVDENGDFPPPPLNGDAYAWHYSLDELRQQIQIGSDMNVGDMPAFQKKLSAAEIDAVIAFFQSKWPDVVYIVWQAKQFPPAEDEATSSDVPTQHMGTRWLKHHPSAAQIVPGEPMKTPVRGISEVKVGNEYVYLTDDGRYAFTGHLIDLRDGSDLTKLNQLMETRRLLRAFPPSDMLIYPAQGKEKTQLTIFTDTSCSYCRKLHKEVPQLQSQGVTVRLIPYPRRGLDGNGYAELKSIWCAGDREEAFSTTMEYRSLPGSFGDCDRAGAVDEGYRLGNKLGISGTPLLILENGEMIRGYKPAAELIGRMHLSSGEM